jgi:hypothetical protein
MEAEVIPQPAVQGHGVSMSAKELKLGFIVTGSDDAIALVRQMAPAADCAIEDDRSGQLLMAQAFDDAGTIDAALPLAQKVLRLLNSFLWHRHVNVGVLVLGPGVQRNADGTRKHFITGAIDAVLVPSGRFRISLAGHVSNPGGSMESPPPPEEPEPVLAQAARLSPAFEDALLMCGKPQNLGELYKIAEALAEATQGGPAKGLQSLDQFFPGERKRFEKTANDRRVIGPEKSRHYKRSGPKPGPKDTMTEAECHEYIRRLLLPVARKVIARSASDRADRR